MSSSSSSYLAKLRIVAFNDVYELANLPKLQTLLSKLSSSSTSSAIAPPPPPPPSAIILAGDFLSPSTLSSIDGGRGMVATLRALGLTHVTLGNHEADLSLSSLHDRLQELSKSTTIINSNVGLHHHHGDDDLLPSSAQWIASSTNPPSASSSAMTQPYSIITSSCSRINVALLGLLTDEPNVFRDNTFRGIPIHNVLDTYSEMNRQLVHGRSSSSVEQQTVVDLCIPITHQSMTRDRELAKHMLQEEKRDIASDVVNNNNNLGLIIGGHEHEPYDEYVNTTTSNGGSSSQNNGIRVLKSGMDANAVNLIDLTFDLSPSKDDNEEQQQQKAQLVNIESELVELSSMEPSILLQNIVDSHMSIVNSLEDEVIIDTDNTNNLLGPGEQLSSERARYQQTTVGSIFCSMIKDEINNSGSHDYVDVCVINGAPIKGNRTYPNGKISYADLKKELPFPTKIVVVEMKRWELQSAIDYSRTSPRPPSDKDKDKDSKKAKAKVVEGERDKHKNNNEEFPRRGYLQVDTEFEANGSHIGGPDDVLHVAVPRNLLSGFCNLIPLMEVGKRLKSEGLFPGDDDYVPAIDLIVRHSCKNRWFQIYQNMQDGSSSNNLAFDELDLNNDGVLDRDEVKQMMKKLLGHEPSDFVVDDMISSIDTDENGVIDMGEFSYLLATMEREHGWRQF